MLLLSELLRRITRISARNESSDNERDDGCEKVERYSVINSSTNTILCQNNETAKKKEAVSRSIGTWKSEVGFSRNEMILFRGSGSFITCRVGRVKLMRKRFNGTTYPCEDFEWKRSLCGIEFKQILRLTVSAMREAVIINGEKKIFVRYVGGRYPGFATVKHLGVTIRRSGETQKLIHSITCNDVVSGVCRPLTLGVLYQELNNKGGTPVESDEKRSISERLHDESIIDNPLAINESANSNRFVLQAANYAVNTTSSIIRSNLDQFNVINGQMEKERNTRRYDGNCDAKPAIVKANKRPRLSSSYETLQFVTSSSKLSTEECVSKMVFDSIMSDSKLSRDKCSSHIENKDQRAHWYRLQSKEPLHQRPSERYRHLLPPLRKKYVRHLSGRITWTGY